MLPSPDAVATLRGWLRVLADAEEGRPTAAPPPVADRAATDLVRAVARHRVLEPVLAHADLLGLPESVRSPLADLHASRRRAAPVQLLELARLAEELDAADLPWLLVKGPALAALTTGDPLARGPGDLDLLVRPADVATVHEVLVRHGWWPGPRSRVEPGTWAWRHVLRVSQELTYGGTRCAVDVHWRLDPTWHALPGAETLLQRSVVVDVAGTAVRTPAPGDALRHLCHAVARDDWCSLRPLLDLRRLARHVDDWRVLGAVDHRALAVVRAHVGLPSDVPTWLHERLDAVPRRVLERAARREAGPVAEPHEPPLAKSRRDLAHSVRASPRADDTVRALVGVLLPAADAHDLRHRSAAGAVPAMVLRRVRWAAHRLRHWLSRAAPAADGPVR